MAQISLIFLKVINHSVCIFFNCVSVLLCFGSY